MSSTSAHAVASAIADRHRNRAAFTLELPPEHAGEVAFGYAVQVQLLPMLSAGGDRAGYKIGLTTTRMQQMCGVSEPIVGVILRERMATAPATLRAADYVRLGIECEIAVRIGRALPEGEPTPQAVLACLDGACAAFELVDDSGADYGRLSAATLVADNAWNAGLVTGQVRSLEGLSSLGERKGVLTLNGELADTGSSSDVLGDPALAVSWVDRHLRAHGGGLKPGDWVSTGSIVPTRFVAPGQTWRFEVEGFEPVEVAIQ
jgi:2-keto-4-pentenoate hydratase